jgi:steroid 5-alpha reductase family enzyme
VTSARVLGLVWLLAAVLMTCGWLWQRRYENAGIVDVLWAAGLAGSAVLCALSGAGAGAIPVRVLLGLCGGLWGARLAVHLGRRVHGEAEDGRYRHLRTRWREQRQWFAFFQLQAALVVLFSAPFLIAAANTTTRPVWLALAVLIWCASVGGESLADSQLARFRANPANHGRTCRGGMWRYSRHPNYFFEWLIWVAFALFAIGSPYGYLALVSPILILFFLFRVTGIPATEAQALRTKGEDYRQYQQTTSPFVPWFPRD